MVQQAASTEVKAKLQVTGFNHVVLYTADTRRAAKFYTQLLGLKVAGIDKNQLFMWVIPDEIQGDLNEQHLVFFTAAQTGVKSPSERPNIDSRTGEELNHLCFSVTEANFDKVRASLEEYGCKLNWRKRPDGSLVDDELYFNDPDGHRIQIKCKGQPIKGVGRILTKGYTGPTNWRTQG